MASESVPDEVLTELKEVLGCHHIQEGFSIHYSHVHTKLRAIKAKIRISSDTLNQGSVTLSVKDQIKKCHRPQPLCKHSTLLI